MTLVGDSYNNVELDSRVVRQTRRRVVKLVVLHRSDSPTLSPSRVESKPIKVPEATRRTADLLYAPRLLVGFFANGISR